MKESSKKPWFNNTIFIIVANHCARSAGSVELPVTGYHIPMLMSAPSIITERKEINRMTAQIDIAPTLLGMLNFKYKSKFLGQDLSDRPQGKERAFISTYHALGFIENGHLIIQPPVKKIKQFKPEFATGAAVQEPVNDTLAKKAIAYYQLA